MLRKKKPSGASKFLITRFPLESAWGGEEEIHLFLADILKKQGIETELLSSSTPFCNRFRSAGFKVHTDFHRDITSKWQLILGPFILPSFLLRGFFLLPYFRLVRNVHQVLFLTFIEKICWTPLALLLGMKVFWGHHAPLGAWFFQNPWLLFWKLWLRIFPVTVLTPSAYMRDELLKVTTLENKITVLPNTLTKNINFAQSSKEIVNSNLQKMIEQKTGLEVDLQGSFLIGTANRLAPEKGTQEVIRAFAELSQKKVGRMILLCAGAGPEEGMLRKLIQELNLEQAVFILGFLAEKELSIFYAGIDLFVLASHREPFGIALLEAMAACKAIVARKVDAIPEVLGPENIGLFEGASELKQKIQFFQKNKRAYEDQAKANLNRYQERFAPEMFERRALHIFCAQN